MLPFPPHPTMAAGFSEGNSYLALFKQIFLLDLFYMHECVPHECLGVTEGSEPSWVVGIELRFSAGESNKYSTTEPSLQHLTLGLLKVGASLTLSLESKGLHCFLLSLHLFLRLCACVCVHACTLTYIPPCTHGRG